MTVIRSHADLIEALRARKNELGLSNRLCDDLGGLTSGHTDKVLGPTGTRGLTPLTLDVFLEMFAVEIVLRPNLEAARRMESRWEQREAGKVAPPASVMSKALLDKAAPIIFREAGKRGAAKRNALLDPEQRIKIAKKAARKSSRLRKLTCARRREIAQKAAVSRWKAKGAKDGKEDREAVHQAF